VVLAAVLGMLAVLGACAEADAGGDGASRPSRSSADPVPAGAAPPRIPSAPQLSGSPAGVVFAADGSGVALFAQCGEKRCRQSVAVLDQGAEAWRPVRSPLPDVTGDLGITVGLMGLGPGRALITEGVWPPTHRTWFTGDGGRTWRTGSEKPSGTIPVVPEGGALVRECVEVLEDNSYCARARLLVVMPDTGEFRVLATQPMLKGVVGPAGEVALTDSGTEGGKESGSAPPASGTARTLLFASAEEQGTGVPLLAASEDRGRTWRTTPLPGADPGSSVRVTVAGGTLYAVQTGELPEDETVKNGLQTIHRSIDAGHTWQRIWKHRKGVEPRSLVGDLVPAADGSLTVHGQDGLWRSTDGARTFERASSGARYPVGAVSVTPLGFLGTDSFGNGSFRISADGIHWHSFELGDGG
jgi:hypothetical protein